MPLVDDLRQIINQTRNRVAVNVNAELTLMYWHIGERINREVLGNERAEYGKQIVATITIILFCIGYSIKRRSSARILPDIGCFRKMVYSAAAGRD